MFEDPIRKHRSKKSYLAEAKCLLKYYELLIANDLNKLLKQTGLSKEQLKGAVDLLKTLNHIQV